MFEKMIKELTDLEKTDLQIRAVGEYPTARATKVAHVAVYQNDGTETIKPAKFVEKATSKHQAWKGLVYKATTAILFRKANAETELRNVGTIVAAHISDACHRVKTGQLKSSFFPEIEKK